MGLHGLHDLFGGAEFLENATADLDVGTGDLVIEDAVK